MSNPEDKKSSKPSGADSPSSKLPSSLRGKMNLDDEPEDEGGSNVANIIGIVMLVGIVVLGALFWVSLQKSKAADKAKAVAAAKAAAEEARTDSLNTLAQNLAQKARADSITAYEALHPKPKTPTAAPDNAASPGGEAAAPPPPATKFGIDVGSFLSQDRATTELGKLQGTTSLSGRVVPKSEDGGTSYHVVIGEFTSRKEADAKAAALIAASSIREATVTKLK